MTKHFPTLGNKVANHLARHFSDPRNADTTRSKIPATHEVQLIPIAAASAADTVPALIAKVDCIPQLPHAATTMNESLIADVLWK
ncbi:hypothetical protein N7537_006176 [Penicillium hordei]|uniref:Uncharacterized protein n=1 Tax=Penicillium hordei TaxID=40994 RepID=A0AAD6H463_9EURO|nr:uncharacterized protein N7537_006176 [Penicillium hordei]KAJ5603220.1 hypothetical protein N7537_006176 [Penicillium hordei]